MYDVKEERRGVVPHRQHVQEIVSVLPRAVIKRQRHDAPLGALVYGLAIRHGADLGSGHVVGRRPVRPEVGVAGRTVVDLTYRGAAERAREQYAGGKGA